MRAVELCSGAGGLTTGLLRAGFSVVQTVDKDPDASRVQPDAHHHLQRDIADFEPVDDFDLLAAGFPCQPFSSSGHRTGFTHPSGTVFGRLLEIVNRTRPRAILLENVVGLLSNKSGHTFWSILQELSERGYEAEWCTLGSLSFGVPQDRRRVFIAATPAGMRVRTPADAERIDALDKLVESTRLEIGYRPKKIHAPRAGFVQAGMAWQMSRPFVHVPEAVPPHIGDVVTPELERRHEVRSVRYWAHTGKTKAYFKEAPVAHAVGTSIGAAPLFGLRRVPSPDERTYIEAISSWSRIEPDGSGFVFRLNPDEAVRLFGEEAADLTDRFRNSGLSNGAKYRLLGNMVVPRVGQSVAEHLLIRMNQSPNMGGGLT